MTVTSTTSSVSYAGDGVVDEFPTGFRFLATSDLEVSVDGVPLSEGVDYVVAGAGDDAGGDVTLVAGPLASGSEISIARTVPLLQATSFRTQGDFSPRLHEDALDHLTMAVQQLQRSLDDALARLTALEAP